jgi:hypothetical protein
MLYPFSFTVSKIILNASSSLEEEYTTVLWFTAVSVADPKKQCFAGCFGGGGGSFLQAFSCCK